MCSAMSNDLVPDFANAQGDPDLILRYILLTRLRKIYT